jgi:hypothetical protein
MATQDATRASRPWERPPKHGQGHGSGLTACQADAMAWDGPAASTKRPLIDRLDGYTRHHESIKAAGVAFGACQVAAADWDGPAAGTKRPVVDCLTRVANEEAPALSARRPEGSATHGECNVAAQAGARDSVESDNKAGVKQTVKRSYPKWANGRARDPQAEAWCQAERDDKEASYMAFQRESNHAAHQGGGTRSPQVSTALLGLTVLSGVTADKILWELTGQKRCQFFTGPLDVYPQGPQGQRGAQPSTVANVVQLCRVVWIDHGGQFSGGNRTARKHC